MSPNDACPLGPFCKFGPWHFQRTWSSTVHYGPQSSISGSIGNGTPLRSRSTPHYGSGGASGSGKSVGSNGSSRSLFGAIAPKGDANILKCLRYRLSKYKQLYEQVSSTWHWTCTDGKHKNAIVTLTYISTSQRDDFLNTVKIPNTVSVSTGYMTI